MCSSSVFTVRVISSRVMAGSSVSRGKVRVYRLSVAGPSVTMSAAEGCYRELSRPAPYGRATAGLYVSLHHHARFVRRNEPTQLPGRMFVWQVPKEYGNPYVTVNITVTDSSGRTNELSVYPNVVKADEQPTSRTK